MTTPLIKIKVFPKPVLKGKMDVRFPARFTVHAPLQLDRTGGNYDVSLDLTQFTTDVTNNVLGSLAPSATVDTTNASNITSGTLNAARLPTPTPTTLGGVKSLAAVSHKFLTQIGTDGAPLAAQPVAADVSFTQSGANAVATDLDALYRNRIFTPEMFGAVASPVGTAAGSIADSTTAITRAIAALVALGGGVLQFGIGAYATTGFTLPANNIIVRGMGYNATTIVFKPSSPSSCVTFSAGASILSNCGIENLTIGSNDTTTTKGAITMVDTSNCFVRWVNIAHYPVDGTLFRATANAVGINTQGRELGVVENTTIYASTPIQISTNPNFAGGTEDLDSWVFRNLILVSELTSATHHCVLIDPGVAPFNSRFEGRQNWIGGVDGLHWVDAGSTAAAFGFSISGLRTEQAGDGTGSGWAINIQVNQSLTGLKISDCAGGDRGGIKLRKVNSATIDNFVYPPIGANKAGLDLDSTDKFVKLSNCWWASTTTASITGLILTQIEPNVAGLSTALPSRGTYAVSGAWTTYTPVVTSGSGTITSYTATGASRQIGKTVEWQATVVISTVGTAAGAMNVTLPTTAIRNANLDGIDATSSLKLTGFCVASNNVGAFTKYDGTTAFAAHSYALSGTYEAA